MSSLPEIRTRCVVVGGGPAGIMVGYLLARAGVDVVVLEKHADFFRDFRGDTIHPSTLEVMHELGLLEEFLKLPHQEVGQLRGVFNGHFAEIADFSRLPTHCKFIAFMPQWDFLNFISGHAKRFPTFALQMQHEVVDLLFESDRVVGVRAKTPDGERVFRADVFREFFFEALGLGPGRDPSGTQSLEHLALFLWSYRRTMKCYLSHRVRYA